MAGDGRPFVVGPRAAALRRRLGPTAWAFPKGLLVRSTGPADCCRATASVRSLAVDLGLAKDTVARALGRLRRAGLVIADQSRSTGGAFTPGSYVIAVADAIEFDDTIDVRDAPSPRPAAHGGVKRARAAEPNGPQLELALGV